MATRIRRWRVSVTVLAATFVASCSTGTGHVASPAPTIVVLDAGTTPRQRLRYEPSPGLDEEVETSTKIRLTSTATNTTLETGKRSADFPTTIIQGRLQVTGRSPEGHALVSFAVKDVRTLEDVVDPRMRQMVEGEKHQLKDAHATWRLSPTGELADVTIQLRDAPEAPRHRPGLYDSFEHMFVRFPDADIGVGAIWKIESQRVASGVRWHQQATYSLRELTDGQATVDVSVALRASSQDLSVEPNATTTLTSGEGTLSGQIVVPRRGLVTSGSSQTTTEVNLRIVDRHLRISSTVRAETFSSVKRTGTNIDSVAPTPHPTAEAPAANVVH